jgi:hypothetical protein
VAAAAIAATPFTVTVGMIVVYLACWGLEMRSRMPGGGGLLLAIVSSVVISAAAVVIGLCRRRSPGGVMGGNQSVGLTASREVTTGVAVPRWVSRPGDTARPPRAEHGAAWLRLARPR